MRVVKKMRVAGSALECSRQKFSSLLFLGKHLNIIIGVFLWFLSVSLAIFE